MDVIEILGGIGLTLFGIRFLRKGLDRLFGGTIIRWLAKVTATRLRAFAGGVVIGTVAPSSTGLALLGGQLLGAGQGGLKPQNVLALLLGANVGLTVTVQLLSLRFSDYAGLLIAVGVAGYQFCRRELFRGMGQCILALGFIFLAMDLIGRGAHELTKVAEVPELFRMLEGHPLAALLVVSMGCVALQSSTATIALGLGLAASGLLTSATLVPWVLGTNVGLAFTSLLAGWQRLDSRRLGFENIVVKVAAAVPLLAYPEFARRLFEAAPGSLMRQTAMWHTEFNLLSGLAALAVLAPLHRLAVFLIVRHDGGQLVTREGFLDPQVLDIPSVALARATRETLRMADQVRLMLESFWRAFGEQNADLARRVQKEDDVVDRANLEIKEYLSRIVDHKSSADAGWQFTLLIFSNELEAVGDLVDKHLCDALLKQHSEGIELSPPDRDGLKKAYERVLDSLDLATGLLTARNADDAKALLMEKQSFNDWCRQLQHQHYARLSHPSGEALASSAFFLDELNALRRINSHVSTIGYAFARP